MPQCFGCNNNKTSSCFSKSQLKKRKTRRCKNCIQNKIYIKSQNPNVTTVLSLNNATSLTNNAYENLQNTTKNINNIIYTKQYYLLNGFIRRTQNQLKYVIVPESIYDICLSYFNFWLYSKSNNRLKTKSKYSIIQLWTCIRPCNTGVILTNDKLDKLINYYFINSLDTSKISLFIKKLFKYKILDRVTFLFQFIDTGISRRLITQILDLISIFLDNYIIFSTELNSCFIKLFTNYCSLQLDDPQIDKYISQLLASLIIDNEIDFNDILKWIILDIRDNQANDMLQWYDGDGMKNLVKGSMIITKSMKFLAILLKEIKAISRYINYTKHLMLTSKFHIGDYKNKQDTSAVSVIQSEWIQTFDLQFAIPELWLFCENY